MNTIFDIESSEENVDLDFSTSRRNLPVSPTKSLQDGQVEEITSENNNNNAENTGDSMRVNDSLVNQDASDKVIGNDTRKIRRVNLHDSALFLARDRALKDLNRSKKSDIISNIMDDNTNFQPRVTIRSSTLGAQPSDEQGEGLYLLEARQAQAAATRIERTKTKLEDLQLRQQIQQFYANELPDVSIKEVLAQVEYDMNNATLVSHPGHPLYLKSPDFHCITRASEVMRWSTGGQKRAIAVREVSSLELT